MVHVKNATVKDGAVGNPETPNAATVDILIVIIEIDHGLMKLSTITTKLCHL